MELLDGQVGEVESAEGLESFLTFVKRSLSFSGLLGLATDRSESVARSQKPLFRNRMGVREQLERFVKVPGFRQ